MNTYSHIYVMENDNEIFENHLTTMKYVKGEENNVFGINLGNIASVISHMVLVQKSPELIIIGGIKYILYSIIYR